MDEKPTVSRTAESEVRRRWWTPKEDRQVSRKLDLHVLPVMFGCFLFSFLDRSNIGNAKAGMTTDLGLSDHQFVWLLTIFYISFTAFQFLLISYTIVPPRCFVGFCIGGWGLCSTLQAATQRWEQMMVLRFFLGLFEAGFSSGAAYYFSTLFPRQEAGFRFCLFISAGPFASSWSGTMAYAVMRHSSRLPGWRALFLIEGVLTTAFAPLAWYFLPNSTSTAPFLTERERRIAAARLLHEQLEPPEAEVASKDVAVEARSSRASTARHTYRELFSVNDAALALRYPLSWISAVLYFCISLALSPFTIYLPTLMQQQFGHSVALSQAYSVPPFLCAFAFSLISAFFCDRFRCRGLVSAFVMALGALGYLLLALVESVHLRYGAAFIVATATYTAPPLIYFWTISNQFSHSRRGLALVILGSFGQAGPFVGTRLFPAKEGPRYQRGMLVCAGTLLFGFATAAATLLWMHFDNRRRQRAHPIQPPTTQDDADERERHTSREGAESVYFRWEY